MEIRISVLELSKALSLLQGVVQKKNTMPILSHILFQAHGNPESGELILHATDLEVGMRMSKACQVTQAGSITVSARALLDIVKMLPGPEVTISTLPNQHVSVRSGRTNARLVALSAEEYPQLPDTSGITFQPFEAARFVDMVQRTLYCASVDENRYNLTGVYFEPQKENISSLVLVATDGHRLSRIEQKFSGGDFSTLFPVTLPRKGLTELLRLLEIQAENAPVSVEIGLSKTQAIFRYGNSVLSMRLIEGKFPEYSQVIPRLSDKILRASRADLLTSLRRVSVLASDKSQSAKFSSKKGELTVSCVNPDAGEVSDDVPVDYAGPDLEIAFNARYIIEALSSLSDHNVMIKLTDALSPTLLTGTTDDSHVCVIMPMRL